jgi:P27 family predicted phage terminase small subunit
LAERSKVPRHPKPVALRANRERRDLGLIQGGLAGPAPQPPIGLLAASRTSWERFWSSPLASIVLPDTDLPALSRLWTLYDERTRMYRTIRRLRMVRGSRGQPRANPLYSQMSVLDATIIRLEEAFGLSPGARLKLGVLLGDAARSLSDLNADLERDDDFAELLDEPDVDGRPD